MNVAVINEHDEQGNQGIMNIVPLVDVVMTTYNQENYIAQAIESVLMQRTTFPFRLIIGDDCSTDNTLNICTEYSLKNQGTITLIPSIINEGIAANYKKVFDSCKAKYAAILEGDDYWIDKYKLQKQVEILEANNEIGLVHSNYKIFYENGVEQIGNLEFNKKKLSGYVINDKDVVGIKIAPLTTCFRVDLVKANVDFDFLIMNKLLTVDLLLWAEITRKSQVFFIDAITAVYRSHSLSITSSGDIEKMEKFNMSSDTINLFIFNKYNVSKKNIMTYYSNSSCFMVKAYLSRKMYQKAKARSQHLVLNNLENLLLYSFSNYPIFRVFYPITRFLKHCFNRARILLVEA